MYDVIIAGAGPAGLYTAKLLEKKLDVLILEKNQEIGGKVCSGLVSANLRKFVPIKRGWVEHRVRGAVVHCTGGAEIKLLKKNTAAYVINREKFDRWLANGVKSKILLERRVKGVEVKKDEVSIKTNRGDFCSKMLIGCDGASSFVAKNFGAKPKEVVKGLVGIEKKKDRSDFVQLWFDKNLVGDGFFWKIPRGGSTEYGALGKNVNFKILEKFFKLKGYEKKAGLIPLGPPKTYFNRVLLIGDAAAQTKPWSGGGVVYGLTCAKIASGVVLNAFGKGNFSEKMLKGYELGWKKSIGKHITFGLMFREFYKEIGNRDIERVFNKVKDFDFSKLDMDLPLISNFKF